MKRIFLALALFAALRASAQTMYMTDETTDVGFVTKHLAGDLEGSFKGVEGSTQFNPNDLSHAYFKIVFATTTLTTNDNLLGPNLIKVECFDPAKYPTIELFSSTISKLEGQNEYEFKGSLKVKGISKYISFPFTARPNAGGYDFNFAFAFSKKAYDMHCGATGKSFKIIVRAYAKLRK